MGAEAETGVESRRRPPTGRRRTAPSRWPSAGGWRSSATSCSPPSPPTARGPPAADIAQRLTEWQGPGIVILCGRLVAPGCRRRAGRRRREAPGRSPTRSEAFAARADSQVIVVMAPSERDPAWCRRWSATASTVRDGVDLRLRNRRRHAHGARCAPGTPAARRQPADGRRALRRPALAGRHGASGRSAAGAPLRDLARALPPPAPLPLGAAAGAGRRSRCCCASSSSSTAWAASSARRGNRPRSSGPTTPPGPRASS